MACSTLENISPCNKFMSSLVIFSYFGLLGKKNITVKTMTVIIYPIIAQNKHVIEEN